MAKSPLNSDGGRKLDSEVRRAGQGAREGGRRAANVVDKVLRGLAGRGGKRGGKAKAKKGAKAAKGGSKKSSSD